MNSTVKKILVFILLFKSFGANAATLVVQEFGPVGTYASIQEAIDAASDGDQIKIHNRLSGLDWLGTISISKSLTITSAVNDQHFNVGGDWYIETLSGRKVSIIGMQNTNGSIMSYYNNNESFTERCKINILNCVMHGGKMLFDDNMLDVTIASSRFPSSSLTSHQKGITNLIVIRYGKIIGNDLFYNGCVQISNDINGNYEPIYYVGNLRSTKFDSYTTNNVLKVFNNTFKNQYQIYTVPTMFKLHATNPAGTGVNEISNNLMICDGALTCFDILGSGNVQMFNNIFERYMSYSTTSTNTNISLISTNSNLNFSYNTYDSFSTLNGIVDNGTNTQSAGTVSDYYTGENNFPKVNMGNPGSIYIDIDLTTNDRGIYGGPYSFENFHPIENGFSSRVFFVELPHAVVTGMQNVLKANAFDK
jgi:hypothetical protein